MYEIEMKCPSCGWTIYETDYEYAQCYDCDIYLERDRDVLYPRCMTCENNVSKEDDWTCQYCHV